MYAEGAVGSELRRNPVPNLPRFETKPLIKTCVISATSYARGMVNRRIRSTKTSSIFSRR